MNSRGVLIYVILAWNWLHMIRCFIDFVQDILRGQEVWTQSLQQSSDKVLVCTSLGLVGHLPTMASLYHIILWIQELLFRIIVSVIPSAPIWINNGYEPQPHFPCACFLKWFWIVFIEMCEVLNRKCDLSIDWEKMAAWTPQDQTLKSSEDAVTCCSLEWA